MHNFCNNKNSFFLHIHYTRVPFTCTITIHYYKTIHIKSEIAEQCSEHLSLRWPVLLCGMSCSLSLSSAFVPTRIKKPVLSFTLSGKHIQGRPITLIVASLIVYLIYFIYYLLYHILCNFPILSCSFPFMFVYCAIIIYFHISYTFI